MHFAAEPLIRLFGICGGTTTSSRNTYMLLLLLATYSYCNVLCSVSVSVSVWLSVSLSLSHAFSLLVQLPKAVFLVAGG